jgi:signal transduction histidine kinase/DNA-binding response OmpR family regulator
MAQAPVQVLIINANRKEAQALADHFQGLPELAIGYEICADIPLALQSLLHRSAQAVFLDASFLDADHEVVGHIKEVCGDCGIIALSKGENETAALEFLRSDIDEYLVKGLVLKTELMMVMRRAITLSTLRREYNHAVDLKRKAQQELIEHNNYTTVRTELWKLAAQHAISREALIQKFLSIVGSAFGLSRASYFKLNDERTFAVCEFQYCKQGVASSLGEKIPYEVCADFYAASGVAAVILSEQTVYGEYGPLVSSFLRKNNIRSFLGLPIESRDGVLQGFFAFVECLQERQWTEKEIRFLVEMVHIITTRVDQLTFEEEKALLQEELLQSQKLEAIAQLAGGVAHDFNNILGAISGYAEMIRQKFSSDNPKLEKYCTTILAAAKRAAELTAQLLAFARKGVYHMVRCDAHDLVNQAVSLLHHSFDSGIKITKDFRARETGILGDANQLQTALFNIGMNARDAMPSGGSLVFSTETVTFDETYKKIDPSIVCGEYVVITITDTGVGMDEHVKIKMFEPFFTTKDNRKGSGLNLASVFGTIKAHKGYCAVSSEPGKGSSFKLYLPIDTIEPAGIASAAGPHIPANRLEILVVDDEELMRSIFQEMLVSLGYGVQLCASGKEAIELYGKKHNEIDLVIIDMTMGELNGIECFRELKKINPA